MTHDLNCACSRRNLLRAGLCGLGVGAGSLAMPAFFGRAARALAAEAATSDRILVVLELSGGNDGLNTLVPYGDDAYYRHRPTIGIKRERLRLVDDLFGWSPGMAGFERLYKDGRLAIVHGCGYDNPSFSHFSSMAYWHTAAPNSGEEYGWVGRLADAIRPGGASNFIVNIDATQSLAVRSRDHTPVVFDDPERFTRRGFFQEMPLFQHVADASGDPNASRAYLREVARSARDASALVRDAWARYRSPVDYGIVALDLPKVAALIEAGLPTRLFYTAFRNNAFDTHVHQGDVHARLLTYVSDAVSGFLRDLERLGRADQVVVMIFSEFGRRVPENTSLGTDHGTANLMFVVGTRVRGGHYGQRPSLTALDPGDNLVYTTDFRRVYATVITGWLGFTRTDELLRGSFEPFPMFA
jgi:uncharacterized protein (DUF1501 family)